MADTVGPCQCSLPNTSCLYLCGGFFDTNVVLTAAILGSRVSAGMTEWDVLTKPSRRCYSHHSGDQTQTSPDLSSSCLRSNTVSSCLFLYFLALRPLCPVLFVFVLFFFSPLAVSLSVAYFVTAVQTQERKSKSSECSK